MANSIGDLPFYSTSPIPLQTGLGYKEQALKNQGQETLNQGYALNNDYNVQRNREAERLNDEAQRQLDKSADLRAAYAQSTTHQPIGQTQPTAQPPQPPAGTTQPVGQSIGGLNLSQSLPTAQTPTAQLMGQPKPAPSASPYGTAGPIRPTQVVPTLAEQTGLAPMIAAHPTTNQTLDQSAVQNGTHSAFQTFTQPGPNGQTYQTTVDRNKLLNIYGAQHPEDVEPLKAQFAAMDAKQAKDQTDAEWQHHVGIASDMYGIKLLEDNPDLAAKAWDQAYQKHAQNGENMNGIPVSYPGKEIFDKMNDQMLSATDRAADASKSAAQAEKAIHDQEAEKQRGFANQIALKHLGIEQGKLAADLAKVNLPVGGVSGEAFRAQLMDRDPNIASTLDGVSLGEVKLPARGGVTTNAILMAKRLNPDVNMTEATKITEELARNAPNTYGGVQFFGNKAAEHLAATQGIDAKLPSSDINFLGIGKASNATTGTITGNPNIAAWNTTHTALVDELKKSLKGAPGGELEALRDLNNLKWNDTPDKKKAVYAATAKLLLGNDQAAMTGRKQAFGHLDPGDSFLSAGSLDVLGRTLQANGDTQPLPSPLGTHQRASTKAAMGGQAGASEPKASPAPSADEAWKQFQALGNK